jgi:amino acid transporter
MIERRAGELRHGVLSIADAIAQSVAVMALALGVAFGTAGAAAATGITVPLAYAIAGAGSLCLASVIIRFTRRMASAGGVYTYISQGLGPHAGFLGGWLYAGAFAVGISFVLVISSSALSTAMTAHTAIHLSWYEWFFPLLALVAVLALLDIRISTRVQLAVALAGVAAVLVLAVAIVIDGGAAGLSLAPLDPGNAPSSSGLFLAVVLGFTAFIGFEAAGVLGEEARDPLTAIPRAILAAVLVALVFYVFVTWAMALGFGEAGARAWGADPAALDTLATRYVGDWLAVTIDFAVAAAGIVGALGALNLTSRTLYAMGRDGGLPGALAWTHPRFRTPWVGIGFAATLTLGLGIVVADHYGPITYFVLVATTATLAILAAYILVALAGMVFFVRRRGAAGARLNPLVDIVLPLLAIAICGYTIYRSVVPAPPDPVDKAPYLAAAWLALGVAVVALLQARRPERVRAFGRILGAGPS